MMGTSGTIPDEAGQICASYVTDLVILFQLNVAGEDTNTGMAGPVWQDTNTGMAGHKYALTKPAA